MIRKTVSTLLAAAKRLSSRNRFLFYLYSLSIGRCFTREIGAVYAGMKGYQSHCDAAAGCNSRLRRNIHRLEKGLIMRPRRDVFARDYIGETTSDFINAWNTSDAEGRENLTWFRDVLSKYFAVVGEHEVIAAQKQRFYATVNHQKAEGIRVPRARKMYTSATVDYTSFMQLAQVRRSVRWYLQKPVPRELIDKAILAAAQSPSACNRQPFQFHIFDNPDQVRRVSGIPMGTTGFNHQFPVIVVLVGDLSAYNDERDRHVIYVDTSLAAMSFMLALETLGLSSCPINWPDIPSLEKAMAKALTLRPYERPVMLISVGYADPEGEIPYSDKKNLDLIRRYN